MFEAAEIPILTIIVLTTILLLVWGYRRAQTYDQLSKLAWLQFLVLMMPLMALLGFGAVGISLNLAGILLILIVASSLYIWLGNRLRAAGQDKILRERAAQRLKQEKQDIATPKTPSSDSPRVEPASGTEAQKIHPIPAEELALIRGIFGIDTFFAVETIPYEQGVIFKGNLRGDPTKVYENLSHKLQQHLGEKYRLFLVEDPEDKPVIIVLPRSSDPPPATWPQKNLALVLLVATSITLLETGALLREFDLFGHWDRIWEAAPVLLGLGLVLGSHEIAHRWQAKRYQLRLGWPFFLPSWQIGCFGAITRFESVIPHRTALFDVALAGPAVGGIAALSLLMTGLVLSPSDQVYQVPSSFFQGSILVGVLGKLFLGSALRESVVNVHPLTIVGWLGLVVTALNLLPAGRLDGGRMIQGIYGRKTARRTTVATLLLLGIIAIVNPLNPVPLYWGLFILFLQRELERPSLNELTEPNDMRALWGLLALLITLLTLIPISPSLASQLGIGS